MKDHTTVNPPTEMRIILIADDETAIAETLAEFVAELGFTPLVAQNGRQALHMARERWPALVMTDLMMPLLDGTELIRLLRAEAASNGRMVPPIILLTAAGTHRLKDLPVDAILRKPFDLDQLEQLMYQLLGLTTS